MGAAAAVCDLRWPASLRSSRTAPARSGGCAHGDTPHTPHRLDPPAAGWVVHHPGSKDGTSAELSMMIAPDGSSAPGVPVIRECTLVFLF